MRLELVLLAAGSEGVNETDGGDAIQRGYIRIMVLCYYIPWGSGYRLGVVC